MGLKVLRFIFFGNYFVGLLAISLTVESTLQLHVPFNSIAYYILIFAVPVVYYTYAYMGAAKDSANPRTAWYASHSRLVSRSQLLLGLLGTAMFLYLLARHYHSILHLPFSYWMILSGLVGVAILYYGLVPVYFLNLNLRNTGWLKPFVIGLVWAATVTLLPLIMLRIESGLDISQTPLWIFLFLKNWMFCTVNAIMFDMKDYAIDYNSQLKTFVVRIGLKRTIFFVLLPILFTGLFALLFFAREQHFAPGRVLCNLVPFVATIGVAYSMNKRKKIFYYLIVIDGLILLKAICGIAGMQFM